MKKFKYILILCLLLVPVGLVPFDFALAVNGITVPQDFNVAIDSPSMTLTVQNGSTYSEMTVETSTVAFTISPGGNVILVSSDRYKLTNDKSAEIVCADNMSYVHYYVSSGDAETTITFTPSLTTCSGTGGGGGGVSGGGGGGGSSSSTPAESTTASQAIAKTLSGTNGGSVATTDSRAGAELPVGLASGNISVNITPKASSGYGSLGANYGVVANQVFDYSLTSGGESLTQFSSAVILTFKYTDTDIAELKESSLRVYMWDSSQNKWLLVGGTVDTANNKVTVQVNHFSVFGLFGEKTTGVSETAAGGDLIKLACPSGAGVNHVCKSVYYLGTDQKRYVFPNENTFHSWYLDFSNVKTVTSDQMASYQIGGNVTIRPGTYLVKITTDPKVYAVEPGAKLRWVNSEQAAVKLYGANWNKKIVDVPDTFFLDYDSSVAVSSPVLDKHPIGSLIKYAGSLDKYYVSTGEVKRLFITDAVFTGNGFRNEFVLEMSDETTYLDGANIAAEENDLKKTVGP